MSLADVMSMAITTGGVVGFAFGTGLFLFAWMVRQVYRMFLKISGAGAST